MARSGRVAMARSRAVLCALARDLGPFVDAMLARIERTGALFQDYRVVVVENDSRDGTGAKLRAWAQRNPRVHLLALSLGVPRFGPTRERERTEILAYCREYYRAYAARHFASAHFAIVLDTDLNGGWCLEGLQTSFAHGGWGGIASNGLVFVPIKRGAESTWAHKQVHYDSWAFRLPSHPAAMRNAPINALNLQPGKCLLPVLSAFGGLAAYTMDAFRSSHYSGEDCEHVPFHTRMRDRGHMVFLNPNQTVYYNSPPPHALVVVGGQVMATRNDELVRERCHA